MYFPVGWPKYLELQDRKAFPISVFCNRDRSLFGVLTEDSISVWFIRVSFLIKTFIRNCFMAINIPLSSDIFLINHSK